MSKFNWIYWGIWTLLFQVYFISKWVGMAITTEDQALDIILLVMPIPIWIGVMVLIVIYRVKIRLLNKLKGIK